MTFGRSGLRVASFGAVIALALSCGVPPLPGPAPVPKPEPAPVDIEAERRAINLSLDDWHDAAAHADEERYFAHFDANAIFLGTDALERWNTAAFRDFAHPLFSKGKAWAFHAVRRAVTVLPSGDVAWFDEDLETKNLGPARGSGVLLRSQGNWLITQYNLALTVPNNRFSAVKAAIEGKLGDEVRSIEGVVRLRGKPPVMKVPKKRREAFVCKDENIPHNAVVVGAAGVLRDVLVRIAPAGIAAVAPPPGPVEIDYQHCTLSPRVMGAVEGQRVRFENRDGTLHNVHTRKGTESWFNQAIPKGAQAVEKELDAPGIVAIGCDLHPWESAFIVVSSHPYFAVTGADGQFAIPRVPPGKYELEAWHSHYGWLKKSIDVTGSVVRVEFEYTGHETAPVEARPFEAEFSGNFF